MSENLLAYRILKPGNLPELHEQMVKGAITDLKINLMKDQLKNMFGESLPSIEKCPIKAEDTFHAQHASRNHYEELYQSDFSDDEEWQQQETNLTSYPQWFWIGHLNDVNKNNAGIQPTTHIEDHTSTQTKAPQNNSSHTKEKVKLPETRMVPLHAVQSLNL